MIPNWVTVGLNGDQIEHYGDSFSGSGTPELDYGAEAARTTWRVAIDAALFPSELNDNAKTYLKPLQDRLRDGYRVTLSNEKYYETGTVSFASVVGDSELSFHAHKIFPFLVHYM
jgi:hypothetical protein